MKNKKPFGPVPETKSFSFPSTSRAQHAYQQAVDILGQYFFMEGTELVKITGNVVTVPDWFPFSPSQN